jgi:ParB-like chromosome segregation protein Spo0J
MYVCRPAPRLPIMSSNLAEQLRDLKVELWPIDKLIPYIRNSRTHSEEQVMQVVASIREFGWVNPVLAGPDGVLIAGHARVMAARKLGMTEVPVIVLSHLTPTERRALVIADNKIALNAGWDEEMLRVELETLREENFDLRVLAFSDEELEAALRLPEETNGGLTDDDAVPDVQEKVVTVRGDLWLLGDHRLVCGDATAENDVRRLLNGISPALLVRSQMAGPGGHQPKPLQAWRSAERQPRRLA